MPKMVIHPPVETERLAKIEAAAGEMQVINAGSAEAALEAIVDADCFFGKLTPEMLAAAQHLRWVQSPTASLEHYVFPELIAHPLQLTNMRGLYNDNIAEQVLGYLLCFARNLHIYIRQQMEARWAPVGGESDRVNFATGPGVVTEIDRTHTVLGDAVLGVIGLGGIGAEIARRGAAFGMRVVGLDPVCTEPPEGVERVDRPDELPAFLADCDYVVIAAPHTPQTEKMFRAPQFAAMKSTAVLVNIGRGAIVDLTDLDQALEAGQIAGAALDVFETEPLPADHPLWRRSNVIITPHIAGYSPHIAERHLGVVLENIHRFRADEPLLNVTRKAQWY